MARRAVVVVVACVLGCALARADVSGDALTRLGSEDPKTVAAAVAELERAPATPELADAWFAAARACEDTLVDPARALALYERILRDAPDARVAIAAGRRAEALRAQVGTGGEHAARASELAALVAHADSLAPAEVIRRADALATASWPGAPEAALWIAAWLRRAGELEDALARYDAIAARWPGTPHATAALRGTAGTALEARAWDRAETAARALPASEPADALLREDLLAAAALGRARGGNYTRAWIAVVLAFGVMLGSLVEASLRGGRRRPHLAPPGEVIFLLPVAAVLVGVALTTHQLIAPAVLVLSLGGLVLAYLSGCALETLRVRGRPIGVRIVVHALASLVAVGALLYIVLTHGALLDMMIETVRYGPDP